MAAPRIARRTALRLVAGLAVLLCGALPARAEWPERAVTLIVPSGPGGGTDVTARLLAERLEARFGQPVRVVNRGQGGGVVGINAIRQAPRDGYTLGILYNYAHYAPLGQADIQAGDFTPIAQYNQDPAGFHVPADSPWPTLDEALAAIRANPEAVTVGCGGGCGGSWPMAVAALFQARGIDPAAVRMIPSRGANASMQDLAAGGLDVVPCSLPEAAPFVAAGAARPLAVFAETRLAAFPAVPTLAEVGGPPLTLGAWRGVVGPAGLPPGIAGRLEAALRDIVADPEFRHAMTTRGFGLRWRAADAFGAFMRAEETRVRPLLHTLGLVR